MFNKAFLKTLTILYVEDEDLAREKLAKTLSRLFKEVITARNGQEGLQLFNDRFKANQNIDLILSDINMPQMNGVKMLENIRMIDEEVPFIFTTARSETEYLLKAIALRVEHYALKPIDLEDIVERIQKTCEKRYYEAVISSKNDELKNYLSIINSVASIIKIDKNKHITFANQHFLEESGYSSDEILNQPLQTLFHEQNDSKQFDEIWQTIKEDQKYVGNIKFKNLQGDAFYNKTTLFSINQEQSEFIAIGFSSTDDVNEKREFHKKVIQNISNKNKEVSNSQSHIHELEEQNQQLQLALQTLQNDVKLLKQKHIDMSSQIEYYEKELLSSDERIERQLAYKNNELENYKKSQIENKSEHDSYESQIKKLEFQVKSLKSSMVDQNRTIQSKQERIDTLNDLIEHREEQIRKLDPDIL